MPWDVEDLPADRLEGCPLLDGVPFQSGAGWWRAVASAAIPASARPAFPVVRKDGRAVLLMPLLTVAGRAAQVLVTPYTCLYQPNCAPAADLAAAAAQLARRFGPVLRIDATEPAWAGWPALLEGFRQAGYRAMPFAGFANRFETLDGRGWAAYLADRPGTLRETIRRRLRRAERDFSVSLADPANAGDHLAEYEMVYAQSWKAPEPFPRFNAALVAEAAAAGVLRLAVLRQDGIPLAAQYWTVEAGTATLLKLAHVDAARRASPGTVLTAWMIRRFIEIERVVNLDFGRGDDPYKAHWATGQRRRGGLVLADWRHPAGALALLRQNAGRLARKLRR